MQRSWEFKALTKSTYKMVYRPCWKQLCASHTFLYQICFNWLILLECIHMWKIICNPNTLLDISYAAFILACRLTLCSANTASSFMVNTERCCCWWLIAERRRSGVELKSTICNLPPWAKRQGYRFIGKILLTAWVIPERQVEFAQLYKYHHQSGKAVSGKLVWKQHTLHTKQYNRVYRFQAEQLKEAN